MLNDDFANSILLTGLTDSSLGDNIGSTAEVGEPAQSGDINSSWWSWTAPVSGTTTVDTFGSDFDTVLYAFTGPDVASLTLVDTSDDAGGTAQSEISFVATAGTTYHFSVDGFSSDTGNIELNLAVTPPINDDFANSIVLFENFSTATASSTGNNFLATAEAGEPAQAGDVNSSWWSWTASSSEIVQIDTFGSDFDTFLSVFTGSDPTSLTLVDSNDDFGSLSSQSRVLFAATAGETYHFAVDGFSDNTGNIEINLSLPPINDSFANSAFLFGGSDSSSGNNIIATGEVDEPSQSGDVNSAWWSWTAPTSNQVTVDTFGSDFDTFLSVFTGSDLASLALIGNNDDAGVTSQSEVIFAATAGETYHFAVDGYLDDVGNIEINLAVEPPDNDDFANSGLLVGASDSDIGDNFGATAEPSEPAQNGDINSSWWSWTAPTAQTASIDTFGSDFDTFLSVFAGSDLTSLTLIDNNDDSAGTTQSQITFEALTGTTYHFAVDGYLSNTGNIAINLNPVATTGDDILFGTPGPDTIDALGGNDSISGLAGDDTLIGGSGDDTLEGGEGNDLLQGNGGNDFLNGDSGNDNLQGGAGDDILIGGDGNDSLNGGNNDDTLYGEAGDDTLLGGNGNDELFGGTGNDTFNGGDGNDTLFGADGEDILRGFNGRDTIYGGDGKDTLIGGNTKDFLFGGAGNDRLDGNGAADELTGGTGNDLLRGFGGDDLLIGVEPNALTPGAGERDTLLGALGADTFVLGDATNVFYLGGGNADFAKISDFDLSENDLIVLNGISSDYTLQIAGSTTRLFSSIGSNDLIATLQGVNISDFSSGFSFV